MKRNRLIAVAAGVRLVLATTGGQVAVKGQETQIDVWTPLPVKPNPFLPPHKAWTKLPDVLAKHKGQQNWSELIVDDNLFRGEYISMAPGAKTPRRFHQDNRAFWIVQDGQIRFTIEGRSRLSRARASSCRCRSGWSTAWRPSATGRRSGSRC